MRFPFSLALTSPYPSDLSCEAPGPSSQRSWLLASPSPLLCHPWRGRGALRDPSPPRLHGSAVWKRHDAEGEAPVSPQAHEASMPPGAPYLSFLYNGEPWDSCPLLSLVPGLGCDGSHSASGPLAGPGPILIPFLSPSEPSPWPSEKLVSGVLNCLILPLPVPLHPKGGSGGLSPPSNSHFT